MAPKNQSTTPRRKRIDGKARLQTAPAWLAAFEGKNIVRSYSKRFGVDQLTAALELMMLHVELPPETLNRLKTSRKAQATMSAEHKQRLEAQLDWQEWVSNLICIDDNLYIYYEEEIDNTDPNNPITKLVEVPVLLR